MEVESFEVLATSHPCSYDFGEGRALAFTFDNILLVDSNTNELNSHGFIKYVIKAKNSLQLGEEIRNTAHIYFDFNPAIVTNTTKNIVAWPASVNSEESNRHLSIQPNPSNGDFVLSLSDLNAGQYSLEIMDLSGRLCISESIYHKGKSAHYPYDLNLNQGTYFLLLRNERATLAKRIVIQ